MSDSLREHTRTHSHNLNIGEEVILIIAGLNNRRPCRQHQSVSLCCGPSTVDWGTLRASKSTFGAFCRSLHSPGPDRRLMSSSRSDGLLAIFSGLRRIFARLSTLFHLASTASLDLPRVFQKLRPVEIPKVDPIICPFSSFCRYVLRTVATHAHFNRNPKR